VIALVKIALQLLADVLWFVIVALRPSRAVVAENLFLRHPAPTTRAVRKEGCETSAHRCCDAGKFGVAVEAVRLLRLFADHRQDEQAKFRTARALSGQRARCVYLERRDPALPEKQRRLTVLKRWFTPMSEARCCKNRATLAPRSFAGQTDRTPRMKPACRTNGQDNRTPPLMP